MITAGSVRGNCARSQEVQRSSWPAARGSRRPPQRGQNRVAKCHSASPIAWNSSGARSAWSASTGSSARSGTHSSRAPGASSGCDQAGQVGDAVAFAQQHPGAVGHVGRRLPLAAAPSTGRSRLPATTSTRVAGSAQRSASQASSVRCSPSRLWRVAGERDVGQLQLSAWVTAMRLPTPRRR